MVSMGLNIDRAWFVDQFFQFLANSLSLHWFSIEFLHSFNKIDRIVNWHLQASKYCFHITLHREYNQFQFSNFMSSSTLRAHFYFRLTKFYDIWSNHTNAAYRTSVSTPNWLLCCCCFDCSCCLFCSLLSHS